MAPEQLEGHDADARSDVFAFGAMVYEMATGRRAFEATSRVADRATPSLRQSSPAGVSPLDVLSVEGNRLGSIEGVVIDAAARHVRYLSVRLSGWFGRRRYLVQTDQLGQIEGDADVLTAMFAPARRSPSSGESTSARWEA